jgi:PhnB protein
MITAIQPYLFYGGRCEEALEFYKGAMGAQVDFMMRYNESPEPIPPGMVPPGFEKKIMHATFRVGTNVMMASDGCEPGAKIDGFRLAISVANEADAKKVFSALSAGGSVQMPLTKTFWTSCFGMLTDKFGVGWMVSVENK